MRCTNSHPAFGDGKSNRQSTYLVMLLKYAAFALHLLLEVMQIVASKSRQMFMTNLVALFVLQSAECSSWWRWCSSA